MDNATKALLIAAAVLIGIILSAYVVKIANSADDTSNSGTLINSSFSSKAKKGNQQLVALFDDIYAKNLVNISDRKIAITNQYYLEIHTNLILEPNTRYIISFDYVVNNRTSDIGCGVGYGSNSNGAASYRKDIVSLERYPNQKEGNFMLVFTTPKQFLESYGTPYLSIRPARMYSSGSFDVDIANFRFKKAPDNMQPENSIYEKQLTLECKGSYYKEYYSSLLLKPNTKYKVSFQYDVISASTTLGCGIGYGRKGSGLSGGSYIKDISSFIGYPNQQKGTFNYTFTTPSTFTTTTPYLSLRPARMRTSGNFKVNFTNLVVTQVN